MKGEIVLVLPPDGILCVREEDDDTRRADENENDGEGRVLLRVIEGVVDLNCRRLRSSFVDGVKGGQCEGEGEANGEEFNGRKLVCKGGRCAGVEGCEAMLVERGKECKVRGGRLINGRVTVLLACQKLTSHCDTSRFLFLIPGRFWSFGRGATSRNDYRLPRRYVHDLWVESHVTPCSLNKVRISTEFRKFIYAPFLGSPIEI